MSLSKTVLRNIPIANIKFLPKNAIAVGGIRGKKGWVRVRLDADWVKHANKKYEALYRGH